MYLKVILALGWVKFGLEKRILPGASRALSRAISPPLEHPVAPISHIAFVTTDSEI
jgi:hypothetical protein